MSFWIENIVVGVLSLLYGIIASALLRRWLNKDWSGLDSFLRALFWPLSLAYDLATLLVIHVVAWWSPSKETLLLLVAFLGQGLAITAYILASNLSLVP